MADTIKDKSTANHNNETLSIYTMVLNRLPILADTLENQNLLSSFILEVMAVLNKCLNKPTEQFAIEIHYSIVEQSLIADLTSLQVLLVAALEATGGNATAGTEPLTTFLKKAKAGSVEVEFGPFSLKENATLAMSGETLFRYLKNNAINKAAQLGCLIDIDDSGSLNYLTLDSGTPFIFHSGCSRGTGETLEIIERNYGTVRE